MKKGRLDDFSPFEGDPPAHNAEEECRESDDAQSTNLYEKDRNDLAGKREFLPNIEYGEARDANGGCGSEEGVNKIELFAGRRERKPQEKGARQDDAGKAEDEDLSRRELRRKEASLSGIISGKHML